RQDQLLQIHVGNRGSTAQVGYAHRKGVDVVEQRRVQVDSQRALGTVVGKGLINRRAARCSTEIQPVVAAEALDHHAVEVERAQIDTVGGPGEFVVVIAGAVHRDGGSEVDRVGG